MNTSPDYIEKNRLSWNNRVETHLKSDFYDLEGFLQGKSSLKSIELDLLGDISGKKILHLQCHFGQDSISLARMGAQVTGVDLSDAAISAAKRLATDTGAEVRFICCDVYALPAYLKEDFDIVFTSYGVIAWLPDLMKWASVVSHFLKPGGTFVFAEFHPVVWMFDDDFREVGYNYFNSGEIIETESGTYADRNAPIAQEYVCWNHSMGEVVNSLIQHDLMVKALKEYDYSPYNCFRHTLEFEPGKFRISHLGDRIPMVFSLLAQKG
jgi:SAM-dependent methyltransferase